MANENKNQDELNANELKDGEDSGKFSGKSNNETYGKNRKNYCAIFFTRNFLVIFDQRF